MAGNKFDGKMRFLSLFPYGLCSRLATTIAGKSNPYATTFLLGDDPDQIINACTQHHENTVDRAKYLTKKGYIKDTKRACGTPSTSRSFRQLTKEGLTTFMEVPDFSIWEEDTTKDFDGNIKGSHFRSNSLASTDFREQLFGYADADDEDAQIAFSNFLLHSVKEGIVTPLSYGINLVENIRLSTSKYSPNQLFSIWKLSHINAMFRSNGFLTNLDRRPYDTHFLFDGIDSPESYQQYVQKHGHTIAALTYYALSKWYAENPGFYKITQRDPDESDEARQAWLHTPVFYATRELPNFNDRESVPAMGSQKKFNSIFVGLAMGKKVNYLCYHGHGGPVKWSLTREVRAKEEMQRVIHHMKMLNPEMTNREAVDFALYFCTSHHQFLALFDRTIKRHKKGLCKNYLMDKPFASIHAIPVNDCGTVLLWCLMEMAPMEIEARISNCLLDMDIGFQYRVDYYYPLTYKGKRVFFGYTMNISKINHVLGDYLDGANFYIACFPEQAKWYRQLFPTLTIL